MKLGTETIPATITISYGNPSVRIGEVYSSKKGDYIGCASMIVIKQIGSELCSVRAIDAEGQECRDVAIVKIEEVLKEYDHVGWTQAKTFWGKDRPIKLK